MVQPGGFRLACVAAALAVVSACGNTVQQAAVSPPPKAQAAEPWTDPDLKFVKKVAVTSYPAAPFSQTWLNYDVDLVPSSAAATPARVTPPSPAAFAALTMYPLGNNFYALAMGPDGSVWFSAGSKPWFGKITDTGVVRSYQMPTTTGLGGFITMTPDHAMWIGQVRRGALGDSAIGRVNSSMGFSAFSVHGGLGRLTPAADNAVWTLDIDYTGVERVIRVGPTGEETDYMLPPHELSGSNGRVAISADGSAWFVTSSGVGRLTTEGNYYRLPLGGEASDLAFTKDGDLWVSTVLGGSGGYRAALQELSPAGQSLEKVQLDVGTQILTVGPDDALWFQAVSRNADYSISWFVGRVAVGKLELFQAPDAIEHDQLVVGNSLWYSSLTGLNRFTPIE